jgi:hypothetical protein
MSATSYTPEQITRMLTGLAMCGGNIKRAQAAIQQNMGIKISDGVLRQLAFRDHADHYGRIRDEVQRGYEADAIRGMADRIRESDEAEGMAIERVRLALENGELNGQEAARAALFLSKIKGENVTRRLNLQGRPVEIVDDKTTESALRALISKGFLKPSRPQLVVDNTLEADEETEAEAGI